jgi:hypothetical protein
MKEIVCVAGYPNTEEKEAMMGRMLDSIGADTCISSHYPISAALQKKATYCIYDSNNNLIPYALPMIYSHKDVLLSYELDTQYNGWACYSELYNAVSLLLKTYDVLHFVEADNDPTALFNHMAQVARLKDWLIAGYPFYGAANQNPPCGIITNLFSINLKSIAGLPYFKTWEDIITFMRGGDPYFEIMLRRVFGGYVTHLDGSNVLQLNAARNINPLNVFFADWKDDTCIMFVVNVGACESSLVFDLDGKEDIAIVPGFGFYWQFVGKKSEYNWEKIVINKANRFRFTNGWQSPYWTDADEKKVSSAYYGAVNG